MGLFLPSVRTLHFPLLNFMRFMSAHFFSLLRSFWIAVQTSSVFAGSLSFIIYSFAERALCPITLRYRIVLVPGLNPGIHHSRLTSSWTWYYWSRSFDHCIFWLLKGIKGFPKKVCSLLSCERSQASRHSWYFCISQVVLDGLLGHTHPRVCENNVCNMEWNPWGNEHEWQKSVLINFHLPFHNVLQWVLLH